MYLAVMPIDILIESSVFPRYDSTTGKDYQRPPYPVHYRKIARYFMDDSNPILPSAIIAAVNPNGIDFNDKTGELELHEKLRIVDGQHRIEGIRALRNGYAHGSNEKYEELKAEFGLPVIIMEIDESDKDMEIDAFINLNSKAKKVKIDLAEALMTETKRGKMQDTNEITPDLISTLAMDVTRLIGLDTTSFWYKLIVLPDEIGERNVQPISCIAFQRAIKPIVSKYLEKYGTTISIDDFKESADKIKALIENVWACVIDRWHECFTDDKKYDVDYNICKGIGVVPLFRIFADKAYSDYDMTAFINILDNSLVVTDDWLIGGTFSGLASAAGLKVIEQYILGEISKEELLGKKR